MDFENELSSAYFHIGKCGTRVGVASVCEQQNTFSDDTYLFSSDGAVWTKDKGWTDTTSADYDDAISIKLNLMAG